MVAPNSLAAIKDTEAQKTIPEDHLPKIFMKHFTLNRTQKKITQKLLLKRPVFILKATTIGNTILLALLFLAG